MFVGNVSGAAALIQTFDRGDLLPDDLRYRSVEINDLELQTARGPCVVMGWAVGVVALQPAALHFDCRGKSSDELMQGVDVDRFDEVGIEASLSRARFVRILTVTRERDEPERRVRFSKSAS